MAQPVLAPANTVIDGPSPDIVALSGLSVARDGTGGLVYVKNVSGVAHVFVSRLIGGSFQEPQQVDASLGGASSQPVIAAGNGGLLLIAFINGGQLDVVQAAGPLSAFSPPIALFSGASNPAISISILGKAYLVFTAVDGSGDDVRAAYYNNGQWALESAPLNAVPADDAGTGTGRPAVVAAGDGVAIIVWGETGHVYSRRVWATAPSVVYEQADVASLSGWSELAAGDAAVAAGGDSSYAAVAFQEQFSNGSVKQSRVLMNRLHGSQYDDFTQADGLSTPGPEGAVQPEVAVTEYGRGFVTAARDQSNQLFATSLGTNALGGPLMRVDSLQNTGPPYAVPASAGLVSNLIAWQQAPGTAGPAEIRLRYAEDGVDLGPEQVASSPSLGPASAARGMFAGGDISGDAAIAWVQGAGGSTQVVTAQLFQPPGGIASLRRSRYAVSAHPILAWTRSFERWGPTLYNVRVDGVQVQQTRSTLIRSSLALPDGPHTWQVTAVNPAGLSSTTRLARVWVDTVPPLVSFTLTGRLRAGSALHVHVVYTDAPPPLPPAAASGTAKAVVNWGDGSSYVIARGKFHIYKRSGRYVLTVTDTDRAGNKTTVTKLLTIAPRSTPKKRKKSKHPNPKKKPGK